MRVVALILAATLAGCAAAPTSSRLTRVEVAFSPEAGAEALVLRTLDSARVSIHLAAYSFTSPRVVQALRNAQGRGVAVQVVVDGKSNAGGAGSAAVQVLLQPGVPVRLNHRYAIHHDKFAVVDGGVVQTGSFNYSRSAAERNSENVIVIFDPAAAERYLAHWQSRWEAGHVPAARY